MLFSFEHAESNVSLREMQKQKRQPKSCLFSTPSRTRTADKLIKSQLLYQLS